MIKRYTVSTFVAWWIGAGFGWILAVLTVGGGRWDTSCTVVGIYTLVLYVVYFLLTERGQRILEKVTTRVNAS